MKFMDVMAVLLLLQITACSSMGISTIAGFFASDTPNISAQVGEEANKQVIAGDQTKQEFEIEGNVGTLTTVKEESVSNASFDKANDVTVNNNYMSYWLLVLCLVGWVLPTPATMGRWVWKVCWTGR